MIQGYGAFVGVELDDTGQLQVRIASDNTLRILGHSPEALFSLNSFSDVLAYDEAGFIRRLEPLLTIFAGQSPLPLDIFQCSILSVNGGARLFWCTAHATGEQEKLVICEFELAHNSFDRHHAITPRLEPTRILNYQPSAEEWHISTVRASKPLHSLHQPSDGTSSVNPVNLISAMHEIQS